MKKEPKIEKKAETKKKITNKKKTQSKEVNKKTNTKKKKGKAFTLIELLTVIIILGVLMIIAIPSVTRYISDSRKSAYVDTAREIISGARNFVNEGRVPMYDTSATYYLPSSCVTTENGGESPYGKFTQAYIGVTYDGKGYNYYWISVDEAGQGVKSITPVDKLDIDLIESDIKSSDIEEIVNTMGIDGRSKILILNGDCKNWSDNIMATSVLNSDGEIIGFCESGLYYDIDLKSCISCPGGYTSEKESVGINQCFISVPGGKKKSSANGINFVKCGTGTYSEDHKSYYGTADYCKKCERGTYASTTGLTKCKNCPEGSTSYEGTTDRNYCFVVVPPGKFKTSTYNTNITDCRSGTYGVNYSRNVYINKADSSSFCTTCPSRYTSDAGASSIYQCYMNIDAGKYRTTKITQYSSEEIKSCDKGSYSSSHKAYYGRTDKCTSCPSGLITSGQGATSIDACHVPVCTNTWRTSVSYVTKPANCCSERDSDTYFTNAQICFVHYGNANDYPLNTSKIVYTTEEFYKCDSGGYSTRCTHSSNTLYVRKAVCTTIEYTCS